LIFSAVVSALMMNKPKSAPGVSDSLIVKQDRVQKEVEAAKEILSEKEGQEDSPELRQQLEGALARLQEVESELQSAKLDKQAYPVPEYLRNAFGKGKVMIAVTGASGVGKSSWINAVRRLRCQDPGAASTGVTETTLRPEMYAFPQRQGLFRRTVHNIVEKGRRSLLSETEEDMDPIQVGDRVLTRGLGPDLDGQVAEVVTCVSAATWGVRFYDGRVRRVGRDQLTGVLAECVLWDLPGVGTANYPQATYVKRMGMRYFDVVILMTSTRFTEAELGLVQELRRWEVPFFLVRNKADADVQSELEREEDLSGEDLTEERKREIEQETIQTIKEYFNDTYGIGHVYCISTKRKLLDQFDFQELEKDVEAAVKTQRSMQDGFELKAYGD